MRRHVVGAVLVAAVLAPGVPAVADPGAEPPVPTPDAPCAASLADALTQAPDGKTFLACRSASGGYRWTLFEDPYPSSDRWFSYGPAVTLHGQGLRNPEISSGHWTATAQDSTSTCSAEQTAVISAGEVGPAHVSTGQPGGTLDFEVEPVVFSISLTGHCLWDRVAGDGD